MERRAGDEAVKGTRLERSESWSRAEPSLSLQLHVCVFTRRGRPGTAAALLQNAGGQHDGFLLLLIQLLASSQLAGVHTKLLGHQIIVHTDLRAGKGGDQRPVRETRESVQQDKDSRDES